MTEVEFKNFSKEQIHFITHGAMYYILGRVAYYRFLGLIRITSPILFHHAIEYFLKATLLNHYSLEYLKKKKGIVNRLGLWIPHRWLRWLIVPVLYRSGFSIFTPSNYSFTTPISLKTYLVRCRTMSGQIKHGIVNSEKK